VLLSLHKLNLIIITIIIIIIIVLVITCKVLLIIKPYITVINWATFCVFAVFYMTSLWHSYSITVDKSLFFDCKNQPTHITLRRDEIIFLVFRQIFFMLKVIDIKFANVVVIHRSPHDMPMQAYRGGGGVFPTHSQSDTRRR
jgi:hypothetical protein